MAKALVACNAGIAIVDEITARSAAGGQVQILPLAPALKFDINWVVTPVDADACILTMRPLTRSAARVWPCQTTRNRAAATALRFDTFKCDSA